MNNTEDIWSLLSRYFDNSMREDDAEKLEQWLDESNENRRILHAVSRIRKASEGQLPDALIAQLDLQKDWQCVASKLSPENPDVKRARVLHFRKLRKKHQTFSRLLKIAVLILVAFTSAVFTYHFTPQTTEESDPAEPAFNEIATNFAERANIELGDGSVVMLNAASRLTIPEKFSRHEREVRLKGQAFFDIQSDRNRPFYIKTGDTVVEVIGTSFDVRSYPDEDELIVAVREGTVEFKKLSNPEHSLIVNEGYYGYLSRANGNLGINRFEDPAVFFGWKEGRLVFNELPMNEVFKQIERWYDVEVEADISEKELRKLKFSADLKTRSINEFIEVLRMSMGIDANVSKSVVYIYSIP